jgi:hypothetical protein
MDTAAPSSDVSANCSTTILRGQNYCPNCGQKVPTPRLTLREMGMEFVRALAHVDRSALSLIWQLLIRPGVVARNYVAGERKRYFGLTRLFYASLSFGPLYLAYGMYQFPSRECSRQY